MSEEGAPRIRDPQAVDLSAAAELVTDEFAAAPCAVVGAALHRPTGWSFGWGAAGTYTPGSAVRATPRAIFDLASISKSITALLLARLERAGIVHRQQTLGELMPELSDTASASASLNLLSAHRAGLEAHREFFIKERAAPQKDRATVHREAANGRRPECQDAAIPTQGFPPVYSDLSYILLAAALSRVADTPLDELVAAQVARPLGLVLGSAQQLELAQTPNLVVPTEVVPWRGGTLSGIVHDENAWILADRGFAGHAGLFADIGSLVRAGVAVVDALSGRCADWLTAADIAPLIERRPGGTHCAGFDRRAADGPTSGQLFGPETFGHLGFTGTSLWIDPEAELVGVLLTNRVHPTREALAIRLARPAVYDAMHRLMFAPTPRSSTALAAG